MLPKFLKKFFTKRKIALLLVFCFLFSVIFIKPLLAYSSGESPGSYFFSFENAVFRTDEMNLQSFVWETIKATTVSIIQIITFCFTCPKDQGNSQGLIPIMTGVIAGIYTHPPASGTEYLAYLGERIIPTSSVYAQGPGLGFEKMLPYMPIWRAFRDISFSLFVIIFIFIGFAIMFRIKISPQAVVTIESALPKLIIALLLVAFSYAVVGFMVDIMMVINNLIIATFKNLPGTNIPELIKGWIPAGNVTDVGGTLGLILWVGLPPILIAILLFLMVGAGIGAIVGFSVGGLTAGPVALIGALIGFLLIVIVLLIALVRVLWTLLRAYVMVVLSLIFSPFIIIVGALPGSNAISGWFRNLLANLAVLPTVLIMVFLSGFLTMTALFDIRGMGPLVTDYFNPEINDPSGTIQSMQSIIAAPDGLEKTAAMFIMFLVSLVILLLAPRAADIIQSFLSGKPFEYGTAIGQAFGPLTGAAGTAWGLGKSAVGGEVMYHAGTRVRERAGAAQGGIWGGLEQWMVRQKYLPPRRDI